MTVEHEGDPVWQAAWNWVQRQHEREQFDDAALAELVAWLKLDPAHRVAYNKASRLWLLSGLIPSSMQDDDEAGLHENPDDEACRPDAD